MTIGFAPKLFQAAPPPDVRRGFASPAALTRQWGFAPGPGCALRFLAKGRTTGIAGYLYHFDGEASLAAHQTAQP
jgi:hypothetical protein